jgi:Ca2+-binding RTX toxin-like protein
VRARLGVVAAVCGLLLATSALAIGAGRRNPFDEHCTYVTAGPPGPKGNRLVIVGDEVRIHRDGPRIRVFYRGPRCTGTQATVHNIDRIVGRTESEGIYIDQADYGRFGPGATPERFGSEIEFSLESDKVEVLGTQGPDWIRARTLPGGHVALNLDRSADGTKPDYDVTVTGKVPDALLIRGYEGNDRIDARRLTNMGDNHQLERVIRLFGDAGDDTILGSPGSEWRLKDGPGDDLVIAGAGFDSVDFGRGHDTIYGGPGGDDLIYSTWERFTGQPADAPDRIYGGGGEDQIIDLNRHSDLIRCGSGYDDVERERIDRPAADCEHLRR